MHLEQNAYQVQLTGFKPIKVTHRKTRHNYTRANATVRFVDSTQTRTSTPVLLASPSVMHLNIDTFRHADKLQASSGAHDTLADKTGSRAVSKSKPQPHCESLPLLSCLFELGFLRAQIACAPQTPYLSLGSSGPGCHTSLKLLLMLKLKWHAGPHTCPAPGIIGSAGRCTCRDSSHRASSNPIWCRGTARIPTPRHFSAFVLAVYFSISLAGLKHIQKLCLLPEQGTFTAGR